MSAIPLAEYADRRQRLLQSIKQQYPHVTSGAVLLWNNFENDSVRFSPDATFWYFTGINEPASALWIDLDGRTTLYIPNTAGMRDVWMANVCHADTANVQQLGVDDIKELGQPVGGYRLSPFMRESDCQHVFEKLAKLMRDGGALFSDQTHDGFKNVAPSCAWQRLFQLLPGLQSCTIDVTNLIGTMRRTKSVYECALIRAAISVTVAAQQVACHAMTEHRHERAVAAAVDYLFARVGVAPAFTTLVAGGLSGPIIHYDAHERPLNDGDLVIVDCGARVDGYCADLSRTYPVSGTFSAHQRQVYQAVYDAQQEAVAQAKPGMWLSNKTQPERSLYHIAHACLQRHGLAQHFLHGIGHFLGLEAHDVGDAALPLQEGDVITIEPGAYIPGQLGVRIEDDYVITRDGCQCLSEQLPADVVGLQAFVAPHLQPR